MIFTKASLQEKGFSPTFGEGRIVQWQSFDADVNRQKVGITQSGIRLGISPNSTFYKHGQRIKGAFQIMIQEVSSKVDILLLNLNSVVKSSPFHSDLFFRIQAFQDGIPLQIKGYYSLYLGDEFNDHSSDMMLFEKGHQIFQTLQHKAPLAWKTIDRVEHGIEYALHPEKWYALGHVIPATDHKVMLSVRPTSKQIDFDHIYAYLVFKKHNSVLNMFNGDKYFTAFNLPENETVEVVLMAKNGTSTYFGKSTIRKLKSVRLSLPMLGIDQRNIAAMIKI